MCLPLSRLMPLFSLVLLPYAFFTGGSSLRQYYDYCHHQGPTHFSRTTVHSVHFQAIWSGSTSALFHKYVSVKMLSPWEHAARSPRALCRVPLNKVGFIPSMMSVAHPAQTRCPQGKSVRRNTWLRFHKLRCVWNRLSIFNTWSASERWYYGAL